MYKIYKLILDNQVVYIGRTTLTLNKRKQQGYGKHTNILKNSTIELIEYTNDVSRERYWISYYKKLGSSLLNIELGDGFNKNEYRKEYYEKNKEYFKNYNEKYYEKNKEKLKEKKEEKKEIIKEYFQEYYQENKKEILKKQLEYQEKNKEKLKEYRRNYYKNGI